jgi:ABC-2 type transport system ATP-binding protein
MERIVVKDLWIKFNIRFYDREMTIRRYLAQHFRKWTRPGAAESREVGTRSADFYALKGIDITLKDGDVLGILGRNGAGKTTLLMSMAGIYQPDRGSVTTRGVVGTLLSLGAGFDRELTGYENIRLYATLMGWSPGQIEEKTGAIVEFSDLNEFIHAPLRTYSNGMRARLGFSLAVQLDPDILLIDEVIEAGDAAFRKKSGNLMELYREQGKTIVTATHNYRRISEYCSRALLLDHGQIIADGPPDKIIEQYLEQSNAG